MFCFLTFIAHHCITNKDLFIIVLSFLGVTFNSPPSKGTFIANPWQDVILDQPVAVGTALKLDIFYGGAGALIYCDYQGHLTQTNGPIKHQPMVLEYDPWNPWHVRASGWFRLQPCNLCKDRIQDGFGLVWAQNSGCISAEDQLSCAALRSHKMQPRDTKRVKTWRNLQWFLGIHDPGNVRNSWVQPASGLTYYCRECFFPALWTYIVCHAGNEYIWAASNLYFIRKTHCASKAAIPVKLPWWFFSLVGICGYAICPQDEVP